MFREGRVAASYPSTQEDNLSPTSIPQISPKILPMPNVVQSQKISSTTYEFQIYLARTSQTFLLPNAMG